MPNKGLEDIYGAIAVAADRLREAIDPLLTDSRVTVTGPVDMDLIRKRANTVYNLVRQGDDAPCSHGVQMGPYAHCEECLQNIVRTQANTPK